MNTRLQVFRIASLRRLALAMALSLLLAGFLQAAHWHKAEAGHGQRADVQCLLCLHAAGSAGPPVQPQTPRVPGTALAPLSQAPAWVPATTVAAYDARGPPLI